MNVSGVAVRARPEDMAKVVEALAALEGVEVHQVEEATGKIVITIETVSVGEDVDRFKAVRNTLGVLYAEMVYHAFEESEDFVEPTGPSAETLEWLN